MSKFGVLYRKTLGNLFLRGMAIQALYADLEMAESKGNERWAKAIKNDLISLGEGDYSAADHGEPPKGSD